MAHSTPGPWKTSQMQRGTLGDDLSTAPKIPIVQTDFESVGKIGNGSEATVCEMHFGDARAFSIGKVDFDYTISQAEARANARLVAAAPELLEVLQQWAKVMSDLPVVSVGGGNTVRGLSLIEKTRDVIRKARTAGIE